MNHVSRSLISITNLEDGRANLIQFFDNDPETVSSERRMSTIKTDKDETIDSLFTKLNDGEVAYYINSEGVLKKEQLATAD